MIIASISGIILGMIFFGGLWFTIKKTLRTSSAALWILGSSLIRTVIVLTGFYFVAQGSWQRLLLAMAGFIVGRFLVMRFTSRLDQKQNTSTETS
ncbi:ATP synthase subunit I [Pedobacter sp. UYP1]|uniref:ATP synthase subunit I n=1 Tax=Pedobacter sp. UYP1 TaxID=1756396 RepID=UPI003398F347